MLWLSAVMVSGTGVTTAGGAPGAPPSQVAAGGDRFSVVADTRTNSILLRSDNPGRVDQLRTLIAKLDVPARAAGSTRVIYLKHAEATKLVEVLRGMLAATAGGAPGAPAGVPGRPPGAPGAPGSAPSLIQADEATNSVIINASDTVYNNLRTVIEQLDIRRAQVYVEALIVEVTADKATEFGIQWNLLNADKFNSKSTQVGGGTNFGTRGTGTNIIDAQANLSSLGQGLNLGIIKGSINIPGIGVITNLALLARALESDNRTNILSTPNLLTLDNEQAKIIVAQNVPFITGQYAQTGSSTTVTPFQTIERKDVGLILTVKPQITEGGSIRLAIYEEVSRVEDTTNAAGIITNKRSLEATVIVDDGQIVVLGGLIQDSFTDGSNKIPVVGDIPVAGALFRYDNRQRTKTNLMVFLKPTVVRSGAATTSLTADRYDYLIGEQLKLKPADRTFWPDPNVPELPPLPVPPGAGPTPAGSAVPPGSGVPSKGQ